MKSKEVRIILAIAITAIIAQHFLGPAIHKAFKAT